MDGYRQCVSVIVIVSALPGQPLFFELELVPETDL
jgi:hypothetical protein